MNAMTTVKISADQTGQGLYDLLASLGIPFSAPCGGKARCGKCRVKLLAGKVLKKGSCEELLPDDEGYILACHAVVGEGGCEIALPALSGCGLADAEESAFDGSRFGVALDIGTTTLAAALVDLDKKTSVKTASALNPEASFGADVMSRITAAKEGHLLTMQSLLLDSIRLLLKELFDDKITACEAMTVVGNPTMLHIFLGISPEGMGTYPFTPAFVSTVYRSGEALGLSVGTITVLPSVSAFIGSDVMAGVWLLGMTKEPLPTMLLDMGTNGEIILVNENRIYAASCAAGPAFEGANISSGLGGVSGAVSELFEREGRLTFRTVGDAPAVGICGAGLIDLTAYLLDQGILDDTGYLEEDFVIEGFHNTKIGMTYQKTAVTLTPEDVREVQLAKAALRAGIETLLVEDSLSHTGVSKLYLAGGLGYYIARASACRIGLFAADLEDVIEPVGNTALKGAIAALCTEGAVFEMEALCQSTVTVELNDRAFFSECYMEEMLFPEK